MIGSDLLITPMQFLKNDKIKLNHYNFIKRDNCRHKLTKKTFLKDTKLDKM